MIKEKEIAFKWNIEEQPEVSLGYQLTPGDIFWKGSSKSIYRVIKTNNLSTGAMRGAYSKEEREQKIIVYNLSLNLIGTIDRDERVCVANRAELTIK